MAEPPKECFPILTALRAASYRPEERTIGVQIFFSVGNISIFRTPRQEVSFLAGGAAAEICVIQLCCTSVTLLQQRYYTIVNLYYTIFYKSPLSSDFMARGSYFR